MQQQLHALDSSSAGEVENTTIDLSGHRVKPQGGNTRHKLKNSHTCCVHGAIVLLCKITSTKQHNCPDHSDTWAINKQSNNSLLKVHDMWLNGNNEHGNLPEGGLLALLPVWLTKHQLGYLTVQLTMESPAEKDAEPQYAVY